MAGTSPLLCIGHAVVRIPLERGIRSGVS